MVLSLDPFKLALEAVSIGVGALEQNAAQKRQRKKNIFRMQKDLEENLIGLKGELGGRASARGLGAGQYDNFMSSAQKVGNKQMDFSRFEAELDDIGFFSNLWRGVSGGRTRSKVEKDLGKTKNDLKVLLS